MDWQTRRPATARMPQRMAWRRSIRSATSCSAGAQRSLETNLSGLREEMQASLKQMQADFTNELTALAARLSDLERDTEQKRLDSLKDVGAAITQLGSVINGLGSGRTGK
ncbi:hypothetical protein [Bradyrhizobium sp. USDA 4473]